LSTDDGNEASPDIDRKPDTTDPEHEPHIHLPRRRHVSPWASRRLLLGSLVVAVLLVPLWLDPATLREIRGTTRSPIPTEFAPPGRPPASVAITPLTSAAPRVVLVEDHFERRTDHGWGANQGGAYSISARNFSSLATETGRGIVRVGTDGMGVAVLEPSLAAETQAVVTVEIDTAQAGVASAGIALRARDDSMYRAALQIGDGKASVLIERWSNFEVHVLAGPIELHGITDPSNYVSLRAEATGSDPTTIRVRAWPAGAPEPADWHATVIDWTGRLQGAGSVGLSWQVESLAQGGADIRFDDLIATTADGVDR
jgi:hypothetical protein